MPNLSDKKDINMKLSKINQILLILCFFLPFMINGCWDENGRYHSSKKEKQNEIEIQKERLIQDSIKLSELLSKAKSHNDTLKILDSVNNNSNTINSNKIDSIKQTHDSTNKETSEKPKIKTESKFETIVLTIFKFIYSPDGVNLSGIGFIIWYFYYALLPISLLFILMALISKIRKKKINLHIILFNSLSLIGLMLMYLGINEALLYGFYITFIVNLLTLLIDIILYKKKYTH